MNENNIERTIEKEENNKVFYWVDIKLNLGNYNSVEIRAGRSAVVPEGKDADEVIQECIETVDRVIREKQAEWLRLNMEQQ
jgi:hypothetical protein